MSDLREAIAAAIHRAVCPIGVDAEGHDHCGRLADAILALPAMAALLDLRDRARAWLEHSRVSSGPGGAEEIHEWEVKQDHFQDLLIDAIEDEEAASGQRPALWRSWSGSRERVCYPVLFGHHEGAPRPFALQRRVHDLSDLPPEVLEIVADTVRAWRERE